MKFKLLAVLSVLTLTISAHARIGLVLFEVGTDMGGRVPRSGHSAMYLSGVCADSPTKVRLCREGELGSVVNRYPWLVGKLAKEEEQYAFVVSPANMFFYGVEHKEDLPLLTNVNLRNDLNKEAYEKFFKKSISSDDKNEIPEGKWRTSVASTFNKNIYMFSIENSPEDDQKMVDSLNAFYNRSKFNFLKANPQNFNLFYDNCTDFVRRFLNIAFNESPTDDAFERDYLLGLGMSTPKGLSKQIVAFGKNHPEAKLQVDLFNQVPSNLPQSQEVLFPMENSFRNLFFLPWLAYVQPEISAVSFVWHRVLFPYSYRKQYKKFASGKVSELANRLLEIKEKIKSLKKTDKKSPEIKQLENEFKSVVVELDNEQELKFGDKKFWKSLKKSFLEKVAAYRNDSSHPQAFRDLLKGSDIGKFKSRIVKYLDANAKFSGSMEDGGKVEILAAGENQPRETSLSLTKIQDGDPSLAQLVLIAHIDNMLDTKSELRHPSPWAQEVMKKLVELSN